MGWLAGLVARPPFALAGCAGPDTPPQLAGRGGCCCERGERAAGCNCGCELLLLAAVQVGVEKGEAALFWCGGGPRDECPVTCFASAAEAREKAGGWLAGLAAARHCKQA